MPPLLDSRLSPALLISLSSRCCPLRQSPSTLAWTVLFPRFCAGTNDCEFCLCFHHPVPVIASLQFQALSATVGGGGCCKLLEWREFLQWSRPWEATLKFTFIPPQSLSIYHSQATLNSMPCAKAGFSLETYYLSRLCHGKLVSLRSPTAFLETSTAHWPLPLPPGSEE